MKSTLFSCLLAGFATLGLAGCSEPQPTNVAESMSDQELEDWDRMMEEEEAMMDADDGGMEDDDTQ